MNGDVLTDIDYAALLEDHAASGAAATIATTTRDVRIELGVLVFGDTEDRTRLTGYMEKPKVRYEASMGIYCFSPRALAHIEHGQTLDFPDLVTRLVEAGETVRAWQVGRLLARHRPPRRLRGRARRVRAESLEAAPARVVRAAR